MPFDTIIGHRSTIASLQTAAARQRLAHAYLFHGEDAIGKRTTAVCFAQALLCERSSETSLDSCGVCRSCRHIDARTHPDYFVIEADPELATPQIKIEQIREIEQQIVYRPLVGDRKICMINDADRLTLLNQAPTRQIATVAGAADATTGLTRQHRPDLDAINRSLHDIFRSIFRNLLVERDDDFAGHRPECLSWKFYGMQ